MALISIGTLTSIAQWSFLTSVPTIQEIAAIIPITMLFFPFLFLKEFYFRGFIQERLKPTGRFRKYFRMLGIGITIDHIVFIPIMVIGWQSGSLSFVALALTAVTLFGSFREVLVTWVYMNSGRNILGSTIFYCILSAWMIVSFYRFGMPRALL